MWETIPDSEPKKTDFYEETCRSERMRVPGGWIVRSTTTIYGPTTGSAGGISVSQIFIVDHTHEWKIES